MSEMMSDDDPDPILQLPTVQNVPQTIRAMNVAMQTFGLLWAYGISVERDLDGELALVGDLTGLPDVIHDVIERWDVWMVAIYQVVERIRDQRDYFAHVEVPDAWWNGTRPNLVRPGLCNVTVWGWQAQHGFEDVTWVTARITLPAAWVSVPVRIRLGQSWLELPGGITYVGSLQRFYVTDEWRKITLPTDEKRRALSP